MSNRQQWLPVSVPSPITLGDCICMSYLNQGTIVAETSASHSSVYNLYDILYNTHFVYHKTLTQDASKYKNCRVSKIEFSQNDRRDETKKMPLEVIFQKSSFRPVVFFTYFDYSIAFLFVSEYFIFFYYMKAHINIIGASKVSLQNVDLNPQKPERAFSTHDEKIINL